MSRICWWWMDQPRERVLPESDLDHHGAGWRSCDHLADELQKGERVMEGHSRRDLIRIAAGAVAAVPAAAQQEAAVAKRRSSSLRRSFKCWTS